MIRKIFFAFALLFPSLAWAHAFLDHAQPAVGSDITDPPAQVKGWFTQKLEPVFSTIQVFDSSGKEVDLKDSHLDSSDQKLLIVSLPALPPGEYKVSWSVVSVDTHHTHGDFKFTLKPKP
jgi:methionine-rich copper-binding protein CopC